MGDPRVEGFECEQPESMPSGGGKAAAEPPSWNVWGQSDIAVGHAPSRAHSGHRRSSDTGVKVDKISPTAAVARGSVPATAMSSTHPKRPKRNLASHSLYQGVKFTLGGTGGEGVPGVDGGGDPCRGRSLGGISSVALVVINTVPGGDKTGGGDGIVSTEPPMRPLATTAVRIIGESTGDPDEDDLGGGGDAARTQQYAKRRNVLIPDRRRRRSALRAVAAAER
ncbi:hypothetical protein J6590_104871 [Homalodisca vitripennis]|nr:hypothetical protein J6590_104871 [Homalodisca vitripennis]